MQPELEADDHVMRHLCLGPSSEVQFPSVVKTAIGARRLAESNIKQQPTVIASHWPNGVTDRLTVATGQVTRTWPDGKEESFERDSQEDNKPELWELYSRSQFWGIFGRIIYQNMPQNNINNI